jgi:hypothetical protein
MSLLDKRVPYFFWWRLFHGLVEQGSEVGHALERCH